MNKILLASLSLAAFTAATAQAETTFAQYGWENGGTVLGGYNDSNMTYANQSDVVFEGGSALSLTEDPSSGTPQAFVGFITGLTDGDVIDGSFWAWDDSEGESPSLRIWASYATSDDITNYKGSASGNSTYSSGTAEDPWSEVGHQWTFDSDGGERDALVIQVRFYNANAGDTLYVDDLNLSVTGEDLSGVTINTPLIPAPGALALLGLAGLSARRRRG